MAVLVQYNDYDSLTLEELVNYTGINQESLKQVLAPLTKAKILLQDKDGDAYDLNPSESCFTFVGVDRPGILKPFFIDFRSKKTKLNLDRPMNAEAKAESSVVLRTVDEDRKYAIQTTIVR